MITAPDPTFLNDRDLIDSIDSTECEDPTLVIDTAVLKRLLAEASPTTHATHPIGFLFGWPVARRVVVQQ